jgi:uncharacterized protein YjbJ (UPF0337 family)
VFRGDQLVTGRLQARTFINSLFNQSGTLIMDKDRIAGSVKHVVGSIREAAGKVLGDHKTQVEGKAQKAEGKLQNAVGGMKDKAREIIGKK